MRKNVKNKNSQINVVKGTKKNLSETGKWSKVYIHSS